MAFTAQLALVADTQTVSISEVTRVSAALQKQMMRDVSPLWGVSGSIDAFASLSDVPPGYWPLIIRDDIGHDAAGLHCDDTGQPIALITADLDWSITASHEMIEMLVDPFGNTMIAGQSVKPDQGRVEYLVEVSDPVSGQFYFVNGVKVSDFHTRHFFDPIRAEGVRYSFTGSLTAPRQILFGGYLTWFEPVGGEWWQQSWFSGQQPEIRSLGAIRKTACGMRPTIDRLAESHRRTYAPPQEKARDAAINPSALGVAASSKAKAERWRSQIQQIARRT